MQRVFLAVAFLAAGVIGTEARGGQQTWILVCANSLPRSECNLTSASHWYHLPSPQGASSTPEIKAAKALVEREIDSNAYIHVKQLPVGMPLGPHALVFKACELQGPVAVGAKEEEWARRGACLR